jgi:hypothetical protein
MDKLYIVTIHLIWDGDVIVGQGNLNDLMNIYLSFNLKNSDVASDNWGPSLG